MAQAETPALTEVSARASAPEKREQATWSTGEAAHVVILESGEGFFGIDINLVQEIVLMQEITEVPGSSEYITGMTDLRGRVVPVAAFSRLLDSEATERTDDTRILVVEHGSGHIGLIVDAVTEVMLIDGKKIEDATTIGSQDHDFIVAVAKLDVHLVTLVDINRLLSAADRVPAAEAA